MINKKLIIGTAQFINDYGCSIKKTNNVNNFILFFKNKNITFDTSPSYSNAEKFIGKHFKYKKISSKLPSLQGVKKDEIEKKILFYVDQTLSNTKSKKIDYYLVHDENDLLSKNSEKIYSILRKLQKKKIIKKIGISIYNFSKLEKIISKFDLDVIQVPFNVIDRRLLTFYKKNKKKLKKTKIHIRSIYLQGLLLGNYKLASTKIKNKKSLQIIAKYFDWCDRRCLDKVQVCINFIKNSKLFDNLIVGFNDKKQYQNFIKSYKKKSKIYPKKIFTDHHKLVNPNYWI